MRLVFGGACVALVGLSCLASRASATTCSVEAALDQVKRAEATREASVLRARQALVQQNGEAAHAQLVAAEFDWTVQSTVARDAAAVGDMYAVAKAAYENTAPPKLASDAASGARLYMLQYTMLHTALDVPQTRPAGCSVDEALAATMFDVMQRFMMLPPTQVNAAEAFYQAMKAKYGVIYGRVDITKMPPRDRKALEEAWVTMSPVIRGSQFLHDLQDMRDFWAFSQSARADQMALEKQYGPKSNIAEKAMQAERARSTPWQKIVVQAWYALDQRMPSEMERAVRR